MDLFQSKYMSNVNNETMDLFQSKYMSSEISAGLFQP